MTAAEKIWAINTLLRLSRTYCDAPVRGVADAVCIVKEGHHHILLVLKVLALLCAIASTCLYHRAIYNRA